MSVERGVDQRGTVEFVDSFDTGAALKARNIPRLSPYRVYLRSSEIALGLFKCEEFVKLNRFEFSEVRKQNESVRTIYSH